MRSIPVEHKNDKEQIVYVALNQYSKTSRTLDIHVAQGTSDANGVFTQRGNNIEVLSIQEADMPKNLDILSDAAAWALVDAKRKV